jgi:hypothetical protein
VATTARLSTRIDTVLLALPAIVSSSRWGWYRQDRANCGALRRTVVAPLVRLQRSAERWRTAWSTIEQRQLAVDSVALQRVGYDRSTSKTTSSDKLLGLGSRLQWGFVPPKPFTAHSRFRTMS